MISLTLASHSDWCSTCTAGGTQISLANCSSVVGWC